jgi:glycosyltransferase involved in cell wall biosynthesis
MQEPPFTKTVSGNEKIIPMDEGLGESPRLISFALFTYNQEQFIQEAVESALSQTYSPLEIILSDDCSSDLTFEIMKGIIKNYQGPHKIILNRNEQNLGIGAHVNKIYELSSGELIVMAAGDDISDPERVKIIYQVWQKSGFKDISIYSAVIPVDKNGREIKTIYDHASIAPAHFSSLQEVIKNDDCAVLGASQAVSKKLFENFPPLDKRIFREDNVLSFRALLSDGIFFIERPLVRYRHHESNVVSACLSASNASLRIKARKVKLTTDYEDKYWTRQQWMQDARHIKSQKLSADLHEDLERLIKIKYFQIKILKSNFVLSLWYVIYLSLKAKQLRGVGVFMYKYFGFH